MTTEITPSELREFAKAEPQDTGIGYLQTILGDCADILEKRDREIAELRTDAMRYRWIRKSDQMETAACYLLPVHYDVPKTPEEFDAAISRAEKGTP